MFIKCKSADILFFKKYCFADTGAYARHFGLVLLPPHLTRISVLSKNLVNNVLCCVITSKKSKRFSILLRCNKYRCFVEDSYACFDRQDINSLSDLDDKYKQPVGSLDKNDIRQSLKKIKAVLFSHPVYNKDKFRRATIIREWKNIRDNL